MPPKKKCSVCRKVFRPDSRVGDRQRACSEKQCQRRRRAQTQASWRSRNASYQISHRLNSRALTAAASESAEKAGDKSVSPPPPLRLPPELAAFPWDLARTELGHLGAELLTTLALMLVRHVKDQKMTEKPLPVQVCTPTGRDP